MRLFVMGESRFGAVFLRAAMTAGHEIVAVCPTSKAGGADPFSAAATAAGVAIVPRELILDGVADQVRASGAELLVLANVGRLVPKSVLQACRAGAICFHPSLLPRHRGRRAVVAALKAGDAHTGVSIFWPDDGADTGPLIIQARVEIAAGETPLGLYHVKLVPVGAYCMLSAIAAIAAGCAPRMPQLEVVAQLANSGGKAV